MCFFDFGIFLGNLYYLTLGNTVETAFDLADADLICRYGDDCDCEENDPQYSRFIPLITKGRYWGSSDLTIVPCP